MALMGLLWLLAPVLAPFAVAAMLAYALHPMVRRLQAVLGPRVPALVSVVVVELLALCAVVGLALLAGFGGCNVSGLISPRSMRANRSMSGWIVCTPGLERSPVANLRGKVFAHPAARATSPRSR